MNPNNLKRLLLAPTAIMALILAGCLNEQAAVNTPATVDITEKSSDPRIEFLVAEGGVKRELVSVSYDLFAGDTAYILEPAISAEQKKRGMKGTGVGFKASELDKIIKANEARKAKEVAAEPAKNKSKSGLLVKKAHTRWDHWYAPVDVKKLSEVRNVRVFIYKVGPPRLGPNWIAAVRSAITAWNAQASGTAMRFVETQSETSHDISFRGSFGIGSDYSLTSTAFLTADQYMDPDGISLYVNTGYEHTGVPHNQKTTVAMALLALSTNITFTGGEGYYWNNGASIHVPGTPSTEGDGLTAGSSILTYGTSSVSTPVMTAGDLKTFRTIYPTFADLSINIDNRLFAAGVGFIDNNVKSFQFSGDTIVYHRMDGKLFRRIGANGANVQLWPGPGSSGNVLEFLYDKGYLAVQNSYAKMFTRTPTGNWINQTPSSSVASTDFRLDGNRLVTRNPARTMLYSYYLGSTGASSPSMDWYNSSGTITDWQVRNGLLVVVDGGHVYGMQNYQGWYYLHSPSSGPAYNVQLSDQLMTMFYKPVGAQHFSLAIRHGGLGGWWDYYTDPVYKADDIDLCGDKVAFLQQTKYLRIIDFSTWTVYEHYTLPTGGNFKKTKLSGPNCDFVTSLDPWGPAMWAKYGVDLDNQYLIHHGAVKSISQGSVPTP